MPISVTSSKSGYLQTMRSFIKTVKARNDVDSYKKTLHLSKNGRNTGEWNLIHLNVIAFPLPVSGIPSPIHTHFIRLEKLSSAKYLGVTLSAKLSWSEHVTSIVSKANRALGMIRRNINVAPLQAKSQAYRHFSFAIQAPHSAVRTRGHTFKLKRTRYRLNIAQHLFCNRVVSIWNGLPQHKIIVNL